MEYIAGKFDLRRITLERAKARLAMGCCKFICLSTDNATALDGGWKMVDGGRSRQFPRRTRAAVSRGKLQASELGKDVWIGG